MKTREAQALLSSLLNDAGKAFEIARVAARNNESLAGDNPYGNRFPEVAVALSTTEGKAYPFLTGLGLPATDLTNFTHNLSVLRATKGWKAFESWHP
jgi:hypothetical protein